jgi:predicted Zn-dependent protease
MSKKLALVFTFSLMIFLLAESVGCAESLFDSLALGLEKNIGLYNYQSVTMEKKVVQLPPAKAEHLNELFGRLVSHSARRKELHFRLTVIRDDSVNAFALPGGYVFVNTGLLSYVKNDSELAGVLGHEIAHIDRSHSMKSIYRSAGISMALVLLLNNDDDARRKQIFSEIAGISMRLAQLGYSRSAEFEADRYGLAIMEESGYNKQDLLNFWRRFRAQSAEPGKALTILSTHPPTSERIRQIESLP